MTKLRAEINLRLRQLSIQDLYRRIDKMCEELGNVWTFHCRRKRTQNDSDLPLIQLNDDTESRITLKK